MSVRDNFWPMADRPGSGDCTSRATSTRSLTVIMMVCVVVILANAVWKWTRVLSGRQAIEVGVH